MTVFGVREVVVTIVVKLGLIRVATLAAAMVSFAWHILHKI